MAQEKALGLAVVQLLEAKGADGDVVEKISTLFEVNAKSEEHKAAFGVGKSLGEIWAAGTAALGVAPAGLPEPEAAGTSELEKSPKFVQYLEKVTEKGYFGNLEKDSQGYKDRYAKLVLKFKEKFAEAAAPASTSESDDVTGDKYKEEGNKYLQEGDYEAAAASYSKAIDACPAGKNSHIYYCNRAAAYLHLKRDEEALEDCSISATLMPDYSKAHARAAQANQRLGRKEDAIASANRTIELDPTNAVALAVLKACGGGSSVAPGGNPMAGLGGMADMLRGMDPSTLDGLRNMGQSMGGGGAGGMPDIGSMMNNPQMMAAAQQMMQNPAMMEMAQKMMQDPNAMSNLMNMFGGMGGMGGR